MMVPSHSSKDNCLGFPEAEFIKQPSHFTSMHAKHDIITDSMKLQIMTLVWASMA
jgi:hypothetical protein